MHEETLALINRLANERHDLYRLAGKHLLTPALTERLNHLTNELTVLWDRYRRELVVETQPRIQPKSPRRLEDFAA